MKVIGRSDTGRVRPTNQDAFVCGELSDTTCFAVVCDGMGGANGGNVASAIAIKVIADRIVDTYRDGMTETSLRHMLEAAVSAANIEIFDAAADNLDLRGMGTTVVAVIAGGNKAYIAHVGDSRAYMAGTGGFDQITLDHSVVQAMVEKGQLTQSEARNHPRKHFLTRALGVEEDVECDFTSVDFSGDDLLLLCTDGLTNMVETDDIYAVIRASSPEDVPDALIAAANMAGGSDNITAVVFTCA